MSSITPRKYPGVFIVVEGVDGCGSTTHSRLLAKALKSGGREATLIAVDLNKDGIDEIIVRGQVTSTESAIIVFQWNAAQSQFLPIEITNDGDDRKPFLFTDNASSVSIENGRIEVHLTRVDQSGRSAQVVERYRWDGDGLKYFEDH